MSTYQPVYIEFPTFDPSVNACGASVQVCNLWCARLQVVVSGLNGNPLLTLEASIDGVNWSTYDECPPNIPLQNGVNVFRVNKTDALYFRICIDPAGNTTGTNESNRALLKKD